MRIASITMTTKNLIASDWFHHEHFNNECMTEEEIDVTTRKRYSPGDAHAITQDRRAQSATFPPSGYRQYINKHPDEFKDYFEQRRHEFGLLKAVLRNLSNDDKRRLQAYYNEHN
jgi:hypothetical protein